MENIKINIGGEDFEFTYEVLFKHMRKIEPLSKKQALGDITELDFILEIAEVLCVSDNKESIKDKIDNLNMDGIKKFTKDFEIVGNILEKINDEESKKK